MLTIVGHSYDTNLIQLNTIQSIVILKSMNDRSKYFMFVAFVFNFLLGSKCLMRCYNVLFDRCIVKCLYFLECLT